MKHNFPDSHKVSTHKNWGEPRSRSEVCSKAEAKLMISASSKALPINCKPIGRIPLSVCSVPQGRLMAGRPATKLPIQAPFQEVDTLYVSVFVLTQMSYSMLSICSSDLPQN